MKKIFTAVAIIELIAILVISALYISSNGVGNLGSIGITLGLVLLGFAVVNLLVGMVLLITMIFAPAIKNAALSILLMSGILFLASLTFCSVLR